MSTLLQVMAWHRSNADLLSVGHLGSGLKVLFAPSQWEMAFLCNISHWLGASLESALINRSSLPIYCGLVKQKWFTIHLVDWGPFYYHRLWWTLIPAWIRYKVWGEITDPFPNFSSGPVEVWKWISNFIAHFTWHVIIYQCPNLS